MYKCWPRQKIYNIELSFGSFGYGVFSFDLLVLIGLLVGDVGRVLFSDSTLLLRVIVSAYFFCQAFK